MAVTSLNHYLDAGWMEYAFECTRKDGAVGVDGVTGQAHAENLQQNLAAPAASPWPSALLSL